MIRFTYWRILEKAYLGTAPPLVSLYSFFGSWGRALSSVTDYRGNFRKGLLDGIKLDDAVDLFSAMVKSRPLPSIIEFSKLLSAVAKMKKFDVVISLGEQMQKLGISHDLYTYNILINCFCRRSQLSLALAILGIEVNQSIGIGIYLILSQSLISMRSSGKEPKNKFVRALPLEPKANNIILIGS
ncbi:Pentatricopeptide repeat-containing protein [Cardamine amara subsp. amara]|uniref:Pentatricopeptide repeat-containing protein n=1 Tax=Cardamine amara subsp. amara TaxID=228776 RepID=A0ABD0ZRD5_CARAN